MQTQCFTALNGLRVLMRLDLRVCLMCSPLRGARTSRGSGAADDAATKGEERGKGGCFELALAVSGQFAVDATAEETKLGHDATCRPSTRVHSRLLVPMVNAGAEAEADEDVAGCALSD
jgi:hypothetical protein